MLNTNVNAWFTGISATHPPRDNTVLIVSDGARIISHHQRSATIALDLVIDFLILYYIILFLIDRLPSRHLLRIHRRRWSAHLSVGPN